MPAGIVKLLAESEMYCA